MELVTGAVQHYQWGARDVLPAFFGVPGGGEPWAEVWFGAHPLGPTATVRGETLAEHIARDPEGTLGADVIAACGPRLPYLLKFIAPGQPLSLQVHPNKEAARAGWQREENAGIALDDPTRNYPDDNHKPELVYALTAFEALSGFRAPRRAREILAQLDVPLGRELARLIDTHPGHAGLEAAARCLLEPASRPEPGEVADLAACCEQRVRARVSPSVRADRIVTELAARYPGDPAAILALLLNPVTLYPGQTLYTPAGAIHCYIRGFAVEIMADSDNVLRMGLTAKHTDPEEALRHVVFRGAPPVRIAAEETAPHTKTFYAPVDDFELTVVNVPADETVRIHGRGPRIVAAIAGRVRLATPAGEDAWLTPGRAVFLAAREGDVTADGEGRLVQADVP